MSFAKIFSYSFIMIIYSVILFVQSIQNRYFCLYILTL